MIEIKAGRYFSSIVFITGPDQDFHGALWKDEGEKEWHVDYRFRYYADDKAHDSEDVKNWYHVTFKNMASEAEALEALNKLLEFTSDHYKKLGSDGEIHKLMIRSSNPETVAKALMGERWAHCKIESSKK